MKSEKILPDLYNKSKNVIIFVVRKIKRIASSVCFRTVRGISEKMNIIIKINTKQQKT